MTKKSNFEQNQNFEFPGKARKRRGRRKTLPNKLENLVTEMLGGIKGGQANSSIALVSNWEEVVGQELLHCTRFAELDASGTLHVYVPDPQRASMVRWKSNEIHENASKLLQNKTIRSVKITVNNKSFK